MVTTRKLGGYAISSRHECCLLILMLDRIWFISMGLMLCPTEWAGFWGCKHKHCPMQEWASSAESSVLAVLDTFPLLHVHRCWLHQDMAASRRGSMQVVRKSASLVGVTATSRLLHTFRLFCIWIVDMLGGSKRAAA